MLSWLEGTLERVNVQLTGMDPHQRFLFERTRERSRRKHEEQVLAAAKDVLRLAKIKKT